MSNEISLKKSSAPSFQFHKSSFFTPWEDPKSHVTSYILTKKVAPLQQTFYFVNSGESSDRRYFWFYCAFPPAGNANYGRTLGVMDIEQKTLHHYPETQFLDASPAIHPVTGEAYWCNGTTFRKRGPNPDDKVSLVNQLPNSWVKGRRPWRISTHLTFSPDLKSINFDAEIGNEWYVGSAPIDGGEVQLWQKFDRAMNHAQFNPRVQDLQLVAQDYYADHSTGESYAYDNRMWLIKRGEKAYPVFPKSGSMMHGHEWWSANGKRVWYIHYHEGVEYVDLDQIHPRSTEEAKPVVAWKLPPVSHAYTDSKERWIIADYLPPQESESGVSFLDRESGKSIQVVSFMPYLSANLTGYHIHPHPRFCFNDEYICYTTTVRGEVDVAFVPVSDLLSALNGKRDSLLNGR